MPNYCVNRNPQAGGEHEVHNVDSSCSYLPDYSNRLELGRHANCDGAIEEAKKHYSNVDGCYYCSRDCHTR